MTTEADIYQRLTQVFRQIFGDDSIVLSSETTADDIAEWDSFNHVSLIVGVESDFGIKFQTAELEDLKNVGDFVAAIKGKLSDPGR